MRQTATAEVRIDEGEQRVPALRAGQSGDLAEQRQLRSNSLRCASMDGKSRSTTGIWGMSVYVHQPSQELRRMVTQRVSEASGFVPTGSCCFPAMRFLVGGFSEV
jgi:hypothetical protein